MRRVWLGLRQIDVADRVKVGVTTVSMWERNERRPSEENLHAWASAFGCEIKVIVGAGGQDGNDAGEDTPDSVSGVAVS